MDTEGSHPAAIPFFECFDVSMRKHSRLKAPFCQDTLHAVSYVVSHMQRQLRSLFHMFQAKS